MSYSITTGTTTTGTTTTNILSTIASNLSTALTNFLETIHVWTAKQTFPASSEISGTIATNENSAVISTTAWVKNKIESYSYQTSSAVNNLIDAYLKGSVIRVAYVGNKRIEFHNGNDGTIYIDFFTANIDVGGTRINGEIADYDARIIVNNGSSEGNGKAAMEIVCGELTYMNLNTLKRIRLNSGTTVV